MEGVIVLFKGKEVSVLDSHLQGGKWFYRLDGIPEMVPETQLRYAAMNRQAVARELVAVAKELAVSHKVEEGEARTWRDVHNTPNVVIRYAPKPWDRGEPLKRTVEVPRGYTEEQVGRWLFEKHLMKHGEKILEFNGLSATERKPVARGRATIILTKDDFRNHSMWESILEQTGEAFGEEANFNEPDTVEMTVIDTKAY